MPGDRVAALPSIRNTIPRPSTPTTAMTRERSYKQSGHGFQTHADAHVERTEEHERCQTESRSLECLSADVQGVVGIHTGISLSGTVRLALGTDLCCYHVRVVGAGIARRSEKLGL